MPKGKGTHDPGKRDDTTEQEREFADAVEWWVYEVEASPIAVKWWVDNKISPEQP